MVQTVWTAKGQGPRTQDTRPLSWRRSSTSIDIWPGEGGSRWPTCSTWPRDRSRSGFRTGGWSGRRTTRLPTWPRLRGPPMSTSCKEWLQRPPASARAGPPCSTIIIISNIIITTMHQWHTPITTCKMEHNSNDGESEEEGEKKEGRKEVGDSPL